MGDLATEILTWASAYPRLATWMHNACGFLTYVMAFYMEAREYVFARTGGIQRTSALAEAQDIGGHALRCLLSEIVLVISAKHC